ncbi:MAG: hypothetical protein IPP74_09575 [Alphaproteobacteria bacterium]|nr:hypothetical protein [Alphaproteobacteria bacterium]
MLDGIFECIRNFKLPDDLVTDFDCNPGVKEDQLAKAFKHTLMSMKNNANNIKNNIKKGMYESDAEKLEIIKQLYGNYIFNIEDRMSRYFESKNVNYTVEKVRIIREKLYPQWLVDLYNLIETESDEKARSYEEKIGKLIELFSIKACKNSNIELKLLEQTQKELESAKAKIEEYKSSREVKTSVEIANSIRTTIMEKSLFTNPCRIVHKKINSGKNFNKDSFIKMSLDDFNQLIDETKKILNNEARENQKKRDILTSLLQIKTDENRSGNEHNSSNDTSSNSEQEEFPRALEESKIENKGDVWATDHGINTQLVSLLGSSTHVIDPASFSIRTPLSTEDKEARDGLVILQGALVNCIMLDNERKSIQNIEDGDRLKKPIVMVINTASAKAKSKLDATAKGGAHWVTCVILPRDYHPTNGEPLNNDMEQVFFIDSLNDCTITKGMMGVFDNLYVDGRDSSLINPEYQKNPNIKQQEGGSDCGWWATYNAISVVSTGSSRYMERFSQPSREPAKKMRELMPDLSIEAPLSKEPPRKREPSKARTKEGKKEGKKEKKNLGKKEINNRVTKHTAKEPLHATDRIILPQRMHHQVKAYIESFSNKNLTSEGYHAKVESYIQLQSVSRAATLSDIKEIKDPDLESLFGELQSHNNSGPVVSELLTPEQKDYIKAAITDHYVLAMESVSKGILEIIESNPHLFVDKRFIDWLSRCKAEKVFDLKDPAVPWKDLVSSADQKKIRELRSESIYKKLKTYHRKRVLDTSLLKAMVLGPESRFQKLATTETLCAAGIGNNGNVINGLNGFIDECNKVSLNDKQLLSVSIFIKKLNKFKTLLKVNEPLQSAFTNYSDGEVKESIFKQTIQTIFTHQETLRLPIEHIENKWRKLKVIYRALEPDLQNYATSNAKDLFRTREISLQGKWDSIHIGKSELLLTEFKKTVSDFQALLKEAPNLNVMFYALSKDPVQFSAFMDKLEKKSVLNNVNELCNKEFHTQDKNSIIDEIEHIDHNNMILCLMKMKKSYNKLYEESKKKIQQHFRNGFVILCEPLSHCLNGSEKKAFQYIYGGVATELAKSFLNSYFNKNKSYYQKKAKDSIKDDEVNDFFKNQKNCEEYKPELSYMEKRKAKKKELKSTSDKEKINEKIEVLHRSECESGIGLRLLEALAQLATAKTKDERKRALKSVVPSKLRRDERIKNFFLENVKDDELDRMGQIKALCNKAWANSDRNISVYSDDIRREFIHGVYKIYDEEWLDRTKIGNILLDATGAGINELYIKEYAGQWFKKIDVQDVPDKNGKKPYVMSGKEYYEGIKLWVNNLHKLSEFYSYRVIVIFLDEAKLLLSDKDKIDINDKNKRFNVLFSTFSEDIDKFVSEDKRNESEFSQKLKLEPFMNKRVHEPKKSALDELITKLPKVQLAVSNGAIMREIVKGNWLENNEINEIRRFLKYEVDELVKDLVSKVASLEKPDHLKHDQDFFEVKKKFWESLVDKNECDDETCLVLANILRKNNDDTGARDQLSPSIIQLFSNEHETGINAAIHAAYPEAAHQVLSQLLRNEVQTNINRLIQDQIQGIVENAHQAQQPRLQTIDDCKRYILNPSAENSVLLMTMHQNHLEEIRSAFDQLDAGLNNNPFMIGPNQLQELQQLADHIIQNNLDVNEIENALGNYHKTIGQLIQSHGQQKVVDANGVVANNLGIYNTPKIIQAARIQQYQIDKTRREEIKEKILHPTPENVEVIRQALTSDQGKKSTRVAFAEIVSDLETKFNVNSDELGIIANRGRAITEDAVVVNLMQALTQYSNAVGNAIQASSSTHNVIQSDADAREHVDREYRSNTVRDGANAYVLHGLERNNGYLEEPQIIENNIHGAEGHVANPVAPQPVIMNPIIPQHPLNQNAPQPHANQIKPKPGRHKKIQEGHNKTEVAKSSNHAQSKAQPQASATAASTTPMSEPKPASWSLAAKVVAFSEWGFAAGALLIGSFFVAPVIPVMAAAVGLMLPAVTPILIGVLGAALAAGIFGVKCHSNHSEQTKSNKAAFEAQSQANMEKNSMKASPEMAKKLKDNLAKNVNVSSKNNARFL